MTPGEAVNERDVPAAIPEPSRTVPRASDVAVFSGRSPCGTRGGSLLMTIYGERGLGRLEACYTPGDQGRGLRGVVITGVRDLQADPTETLMIHRHSVPRQ